MVQVMPLGEVMTRFPVPVSATAQKRESSGAQHTEVQLLSAALARVVQVMPSGEVMTRLPVPLLLTVQKSPSSGAQQMPRQLLSAALALVVHVLTAAVAEA